jgi:hypothetical protein
MLTLTLAVFDEAGTWSLPPLFVGLQPRKAVLIKAGILLNGRQMTRSRDDSRRRNFCMNENIVERATGINTSEIYGGGKSSVFRHLFDPSTSFACPILG